LGIVPILGNLIKGEPQTTHHNLLGQRTGTVLPDGSHPEFFDFDPAGNLLSVTENKKTTPSLSKDNRLILQGDKHFEYDDRGNLIKETRGKASKLEKRYEYDLQNQLIKVYIHSSKETVHDTYDPLGRRITKTNQFDTTRFLWTGNQLTQKTHNNIKKTYLKTNQTKTINLIFPKQQ